MTSPAEDVEGAAAKVDPEADRRRRTRPAVALLIVVLLYLVGSNIWTQVNADEAQVTAEQATEEKEDAQQAAKEAVNPVDQLCAEGGAIAAELQRRGACEKAREVLEEPVVESRDAVGILRVDTGDCAITIRLTDGRSDTLSDLCGDPGKDAPPGRGIASTEQDGCFVTLTYTDALSQRLGPFCGIAGPQGEQGVQGEPGESPPCMSEPTQCRGPIGERGSDGNPAQSQTFTLSDGRQFSCVRDEGSPATAPTYTCTQTAPPTEPEQSGGPLPIPGG